MLQKIAMTTVLLLAAFSVASDPPTIDAHFMNTSGFDASLSVDGKPAVDCKQGGMCDFKITRGEHTFHATLAKGGESSGEFTIPPEFKMVCVAVYPNRKMDFSDCGQ